MLYRCENGRFPISANCVMIAIPNQFPAVKHQGLETGLKAGKHTNFNS
jgi:hypothetical protein